MFTLLCSVMSWADSYTKVTSTPTDWSGDYLIVAEASSNLYGFTNTVTNKWGICEAISSNEINENTISPSSSSKVVAITIEKEDNGYKIKSTGSNYLKPTTGNMTYATTGYQLWTMALQQDGTVLISATSDTDVLKVQYNHNNGSGGFRVYKNGTQTNPYLYKKAGGDDPTPDPTPDDGTVSFSNLGWSTWGKDKSFSGTTYDEVSQEKDNVTFTYTRNDGSIYANNSAIRFYKSNELKFEAPTGYNIVSIEFTGSAFKNDVTTNVETCTSTTSALSWEGKSTSVTFTRPSDADSYITLSAVVVKLEANEVPPTPAKTIDFYAAGTDGYYVTFSNDKAVTIPEMIEIGKEYAQFTVYTVWADGKELAYEKYEAAADDLYYLSEDEGYLIKAEYSGDVKFTGSKAFSVDYTELDYPINSQDENNVLRPASEAKTGDKKFYMLAYSDGNYTPASLGFYWAEDDGAAFESRANSAYLALPATQALAKGFRFVDSNATAIKNVENKVKTNAVYNLAGQLVSTKGYKGIVIKNGKKVLNK